MALNILRELEALALRTDGGMDAILKTVKKMGSQDSAAIEEMRTTFEEMAKKNPRVSMRRFKAEAAEAWKRAYPEGKTKRELTDYNKFMQEEMPKIKTEMPGATISDRMRELSRRWNERKSGDSKSGNSKSEEDRTTMTHSTRSKRIPESQVSNEDETAETGKRQSKRVRRVVAKA